MENQPKSATYLKTNRKTNTKSQPLVATLSRNHTKPLEPRRETKQILTNILKHLWKIDQHLWSAVPSHAVAVACGGKPHLGTVNCVSQSGKTRLPSWFASSFPRRAEVVAAQPRPAPPPLVQGNAGQVMVTPTIFISQNALPETNFISLRNHNKKQPFSKVW